jgi:hypothetical protein
MNLAETLARIRNEQATKLAYPKLTNAELAQPTTAQLGARNPNTGITKATINQQEVSGIRQFNSALPEGARVQAVPADGVYLLREKSVTQKRITESKKEEFGNIKILYSTTVGSDLIFWLGGDRPTPKRLLTIPATSVLTSATIHNFGKRNRFVVGLKYSVGSEVRLHLLGLVNGYVVENELPEIYTYYGHRYFANSTGRNPISSFPFFSAYFSGNPGSNMVVSGSGAYAAIVINGSQYSLLKSPTISTVPVTVLGGILPSPAFNVSDNVVGGLMYRVISNPESAANSNTEMSYDTYKLSANSTKETKSVFVYNLKAGSNYTIYNASYHPPIDSLTIAQSSITLAESP